MSNEEKLKQLKQRREAKKKQRKAKEAGKKTIRNVSCVGPGGMVSVQ